MIGVPDAYRGEAAKAFVTLRAGAAPSPWTSCRRFSPTSVGRHEMPRALEFRDALPRTAVGKLSKVALRLEVRKAATSASGG